MPSLKIGFFIDDAKVPVWYAETIKAVMEKGHAVWFVKQREKRSKEEKERKPFLYALFQWFEERWFGRADDAMETVSIEPLLTPENTIALDDETVTAPLPDVLYGLSFTDGEKRLLSPLSTYGLWYVQFGYGEYAHKSLPAFWEVMDDSAVTGSRLLVYRNGQTFIAYEGTTRTVPYSVKNNLASIARKSSSYLPFRLTQLEKEREHFFIDRDIASSRTNRSDLPGNAQMAFLTARNVFRYVGYKWRSKKRGRFTLLYSTDVFTLTDFPRNKFELLKLPIKNVFYADPFVMEKEGINCVFFEEMDETQGKAHISFITIDQNKKISEPQVVLKKAYHLSYPFVFLHEGDYYMVPETAANKTVELYKATSFPNEWKFVMNLMEDVLLFDATLRYENNKWWLFANSANHPNVSTNDQLFLFYSENLLSTQWTPHPQNPIATHSANCRPAGRIFRYNGKLYRPAQNNASPQYGYGLKLNEIEVLNEEVYKEREVLSVKPETLGLTACHHLDFSPSLIVVDGIAP